MELFIFARFHARPGNENAVAKALVDVIAPTREEAGCLSIHAYRSLRDVQLFYIHSRWKDESLRGALNKSMHPGASSTRGLLKRYRTPKELPAAGATPRIPPCDLCAY